MSFLARAPLTDQVYFRGTHDNKLWVVYPDGSNLTQIGNNTTLATPCVVAGFVFFQGTNDDLWVRSPDGTQNIIGATNNSRGNTTKSSPLVTTDMYVYFQGTDNTLWSVLYDGASQSSIPAPDGKPNTTSSSPFVIER